MKTSYVKSLLLLAFFAMFHFTSSAQLTITTNGNVGVGEDNPVSKFSVNGPGLSNITSYIKNPNATDGAVGLRVTTSTSTSSGLYTGIQGLMTCGVGTNRGILGQSYNSTPSGGRAIGVYGSAGNASSGYNYGIYGILREATMVQRFMV